jgi:hypothetical protein
VVKRINDGGEDLACILAPHYQNTAEDRAYHWFTNEDIYGSGEPCYYGTVCGGILDEIAGGFSPHENSTIGVCSEARSIGLAGQSVE